MSFILNHSGERIDTKLDVTVYAEAKEAGMPVDQYINAKFEKDANPEYGTPFEQACASVGLILPNKADRSKRAFAQRSPMLHDILEDKCLASNVEKKGAPNGTQARSLFPAFTIAMIEDVVQPDRVTDNALFRQLAATTVPVAGDVYLQPILSYSNPGGANTGNFGARAARVTQLSQVPTMLFLTTSERSLNIPAYGVGVEMSDKALKNTTLDLFQLTVNRFFSIEKDARVYGYMSSLFTGDLDQNTGAVTSVNASSLDATSTGGNLTHDAWVLWLARKRKLRKITHVISDLKTYLKFEKRSGRPGTNNYDPSLERIDPQARMVNNTFGGDVKWILVDDATAGGPVPANTIWGMDASQAFYFVNNTEADYSATEEFALRRSTSWVTHWSEECVRLLPDPSLPAFDVLVLA